MRQASTVSVFSARAGLRKGPKVTRDDGDESASDLQEQGVVSIRRDQCRRTCSFPPGVSGGRSGLLTWQVFEEVSVYGGVRPRYAETSQSSS